VGGWIGFLEGAVVGFFVGLFLGAIAIGIHGCNKNGCEFVAPSTCGSDAKCCAHARSWRQMLVRISRLYTVSGLNRVTLVYRQRCLLAGSHVQAHSTLGVGVGLWEYTSTWTVAWTELSAVANFEMKTQAFEIRVALLGYVSAGKSTVLNALLQGKYSQTAMHRTTAGVNCFRLYSKDAKSSKSTSPATDEGEWTPVPDTVHTSEQALQQISEDNEKFRSICAVHESTFNIELAEHICEMRKDTTLVLVDIPGLNEAGSREMYLDYVDTKWDTFDCAVVVMDVFQGVNTEEQVKLLEIVKKNVNDIKEIPVIVICNKVDDPDNKEVMKFVKEVSEKVNALFQGTGNSSPQGVTFIPISAENAFIYRTASRLSLQDFKNVDESLVERIGCDEVGKTKWRNLDKEERYLVAYEAVSNKSKFEGNLNATNFHSFLEAIDHHLGEPGQLAIIEKQLDVCMKSHDFDRIVAHELKKAHDLCKRLDLPELKYAEHFWGIYDNCSAVRFNAYSLDMDLCGLHEAMIQLIEYAKFLETVADRGSELEKALDAMTLLISKQVRWIVQYSDCLVWLHRVRNLCLYDYDGTNCTWINTSNQMHDYQHHYNRGKSCPPVDNEHHWKRRSTDSGWENIYTGAVVEGDIKPHRGKLTWDSLSPLDICTMSQSILLNSYSGSFCFYVGHEKCLLEKIVSDFGSMIHRLESKYDTHFGASQRPANATAILCEWTMGKFNDKDEFEPLCPAKYECVAQIKMPKRLSDPKHWGHLAWMFCQFMDSLAAKPKV
jgi:GTPase SAR1 family protein